MKKKKTLDKVVVASIKLLAGAYAICYILGTASFAFADPGLPDSISRDYKKYYSSVLCASCHDRIVAQHSQSYHSQSFSDPLFRGQFFKELLLQTKKDPELYREARACIACHSPIDSIVLKGRILSEDQIDPDTSGVRCAFCHTIVGYRGEIPGNGNYISKPEEPRVLGPFTNGGWHHVYSELHTKSEFCGICHNGFNHHGLEIKSTFTEWKNSIFAKKNIQCQDCHMNVIGFLTEGKPVYEQGCAVNPVSVFGLAHDRPRLYTHRFPGSHSKTQIAGTGAITLHIETDKPFLSQGDEMKISIFIDNSMTGHKMPSGSADLRLLWLEVYVYNGDEILPIPAVSVGTDPYDVTGKGPLDQEILGEDIPKGARIYRAIFVDKKDRQTMSSYNAVKIIYDNRLNAGELRRETYYFKVPKNVNGNITLRASLNYLPYPSSFSSKFGLPKHDFYEVTATSKELSLK